MTRRHKPISDNECTTQVGDVGEEAATQRCGERACGKSLYPPCKCAGDLNLLEENNVFLKMEVLIGTNAE